ncbi:MAG: acylphosphatase [Minisyncoccia bacterium]
MSLEVLSEYHCIVSGRVQMVMFRDFTARHARRYGITGTVRNLEDGTVEVVAQGSKVELEKLLHDLNSGPLLAKVSRVETVWREVEKPFDSFDIVY